MRVPFDTMKAEFKRVLLKSGFTDQRAEACAHIFADNSLNGIYTHGLNRFAGFIQYVHEGIVVPHAEPVLEGNLGLIEQYNGNRAPGVLNATHCMDRAVSLAKQHGMGCVAIRNTNHWMRGGTYGWQAADAGCIAICFTNTIANLPPWGGLEPRLGNNPLVVAVPRAGGHVVLDMAISQYAHGKLLQYQAEGRELALPGGYDTQGQLSTNPNEILRSRRMLPVGFWKGSGLSMMLDLLVSVLSNGWTTQQITETGRESGVSQVFIAIHKPEAGLSDQIIEQIVSYTKTSPLVNPDEPVTYPGENTLRTRERNLKEGIPVIEQKWLEVLAL